MTNPNQAAKKRRALNISLWIIQGMLALLFLFTGGLKLVGPIDEMAKQVALSGLFLRFVGVCEVLGALGLVLPGMLRIKPGLTPVAASCLVIIMIGAVVVSVPTGVPMALFPAAVGLLLVFVAYGRWRMPTIAGLAGSPGVDPGLPSTSTGA
jgi:hypothetical protein